MAHRDFDAAFAELQGVAATFKLAGREWHILAAGAPALLMFAERSEQIQGLVTVDEMGEPQVSPELVRQLIPTFRDFLRAVIDPDEWEAFWAVAERLTLPQLQEVATYVIEEACGRPTVPPSPSPGSPSTSSPSSMVEWSAPASPAGSSV